jgi:hypothetical protein
VGGRESIRRTICHSRIPTGGRCRYPPYASHAGGRGPEKVLPLLSYGELLNNAFQHAQSGVLPLTCAQTWHGGWQRGQLAVVDCGIGLREALRMNPEFNPPTDIEAITLGMQPWTSGRAHLRGAYAEYGTRGNGLFMVRRLTESVHGRLLIVSHSGLHEIEPGGRVQSIQVRAWPGTLIAVEFPLKLTAGWLELMKPIWQELNTTHRRDGERGLR